MNQELSAAILVSDARVPWLLESACRVNDLALELFTSADRLLVQRKFDSFAYIFVDLRARTTSGLDLAIEICTVTGPNVLVFTANENREIERIASLHPNGPDLVLRPLEENEISRFIAANAYGGSAGDLPKSMGVLRETVSSISRIGPFTIDRDAQTVTRPDGRSVSLSSIELRLLYIFLRKPNRVMSRREIVENLRQFTGHRLSSPVEVLIVNLRRKIEPEPSKPVHLRARPGEGYIFLVNQMER